MSAKDVWAAGDYAAIAPHLLSASEAVVEAAALTPGETVLDVACGTGNATLLAAQAGAITTGLDITPELLEIARDRTPELEFVEGDAQDLPFPDGHFDAVISVFGCIFAPDHQRTAAELARVGRRIVVAAWTPDGTAARMTETIGRHVPGPPGPSPAQWGDEDYVRTLFPNHELSVTRGAVRFRLGTPEAAARFYTTVFPPLVLARPRVADWDALTNDLERFFETVWDGDGYDAGYLILSAAEESGSGRTSR